MMKIMLVITSLDVGGAERLVTALADHFAKAGHEVVLVRFHGDADLRPSDSWVELVNLGMSRSPKGVFIGMWRLRKLVREFRPDVVNSHLVHANILTRLLRLFIRIPRLISSAHNSNEGGKARMVGYRLTDRLADLSTNVSQEAVEAFLNQGAVRSGRMIPVLNGIDPDEFSPNLTERAHIRNELGIDDSTPLLVAVGRLWEQKDYPNLLHAFAGLNVGGPSPCLVIAGDGPLLSELLFLAESLGVKERVRFLGIRHDVPALLSAADVFVLSSAWEGFGLVVAEAMACGCIPVATDCGGVREVVGDTGYLVPPCDCNALSTAIEKVFNLENGEKLRLRQEGRNRVLEHFSLHAMAERYLEIYEGGGLESGS